MKIKKLNTLIVIIILGICIFRTWSYLKPADSSTFSGFIKTLQQNGYKVKDVTKDSDVTPPFTDNQKILTVDGNKEVYVFIEQAETVNTIIEKLMSSYQNGSIDYSGIPHLYRKGNLVVTYIGDDKKLLTTLEGILKKSYIN